MCRTAAEKLRNDNPSANAKIRPGTGIRRAEFQSLPGLHRNRLVTSYATPFNRRAKTSTRRRNRRVLRKLKCAPEQCHFQSRGAFRISDKFVAHAQGQRIGRSRRGYTDGSITFAPEILHGCEQSRRNDSQRIHRTAILANSSALIGTKRTASPISKKPACATSGSNIFNGVLPINLHPPASPSNKRRFDSLRWPRYLPAQSCAAKKVAASPIPQAIRPGRQSPVQNQGNTQCRSPNNEAEQLLGQKACGSQRLPQGPAQTRRHNKPEFLARAAREASLRQSRKVRREQSFYLRMPKFQRIKLNEHRTVRRMNILHAVNRLGLKQLEEADNLLVRFERNRFTKVNQERLIARSLKPNSC